MGKSLTLDRMELLEGLQCAEIATEKRNPLHQQFKSVRITLGRGHLLLQTVGQGGSCDYLFDRAYGDPADEPISLVIDHERLISLVSRSKKDGISVTLEPDQVTVVAEGRSTLKPLDLVFSQTIPSTNIVPLRDDLAADRLVAIWRSIEFAICSEPVRYNLRGVLYDGNWSATTGSHIATYKTDRVDRPLFIIPMFEQFIRLLASPSLKVQSMEMKLHLEQEIVRHLVMVLSTSRGKLRFMTVLNAYKVPDLREIRQRFGSYPNRFAVPRKSLLDTLKRVESFMGSQRYITLDTQEPVPGVDKFMAITATDGSGERSTEQIQLLDDPKPTIIESLHVMLAHDMLFNICSKNPEELMELSYLNPAHPLIINMGPKEYIVSPVIER